jgi:AbrB family looped-hinge helix DNA binding protein
MRTTIDGAGRVVIPKELRSRAGLAPGTEVEIVEADGRIAIEPVSKDVRLVERDGFLAAEVDDDDGEPLTVEQVRDLLERVRR